jgi:hypothetical protein
MFRQPNVVGDGTTRRCSAVSGETCAVGGERRRSQSLHGTEAAKTARSAGSKAAPRDGRQEGGYVSSAEKEAERKPSVASVRRDYAKRRHTRPGVVVSESLGVERTHVGGAG